MGGAVFYALKFGKFLQDLGVLLRLPWQCRGLTFIAWIQIMLGPMCLRFYFSGFGALAALGGPPEYAV